MKKFNLFLALLISAGSLFAQTSNEVSGVITDPSKTPVFGATVKLIPAGKTDTLMIRSNFDGLFSFKDITSERFTLLITSLGSAPYQKDYQFKAGAAHLKLDTITMEQGSQMLEAVVITGAPPVTIKQDSVEYRISDLKLKEGAVVEDAIKRLDGAEVDKDGNVTASGKAVTKIKVDGKEIFGGDLKTITKNIPASAIDKIQLIDDYGDQANFTGVKDGSAETIINITTKPGQNKGLIANGTLGAGDEDRYQASLFASEFKGDINLGVTANLNNNNTQIGGGGFGGRGGAGGNFGGGAASGGSASSPAGLNTVSSVGLTYADTWGPKWNITSSYFFNNSEKNIINTTLAEAGYAAGTLFTSGSNDQLSNSFSHNFATRLQFKPNASNMLMIMPFFNYSNSAVNSQSNTSLSGLSFQDQTFNSGNASASSTVGANILYNHLFAKAGRNYSVNAGIRTGIQDADQTSYNHVTNYDANGAIIKELTEDVINTTANKTLSANARLVYSEPLSQTSRIQMSYNVNYNNYDNSKISNLADVSTGLFHPVDSLGNIFKYSFTSQQLGLNYNFKNKNTDFSIGLNANPTTLSGNSITLGTAINRSNFYVSPILRYQYTFAKTKAIMVNYFGRASEPQFAQLQPVRDVSNTQNPVVGNPDLNSAFSHNLFANLNISNPVKHTSFMLQLQGSMVNDQIVNNIVLVPDANGSIKQEVHYLNSDGNYSYSGNYNWQKSFSDRQYTLRLSGGTGFSNSVSFADGLKNDAQRLSFSQRLGLQINPGNWMELTPSLAYSYANTNYTLRKDAATTIKSYAVDVDGRLLFTKSKSLILGFTGSKSFNSGYSGSLNTDPLVVNAYVEKQFLANKAATVRFQAFDLLNQSNSITRNITNNGFTDVSSNRLTQYFMLTLTMKINKFAGSAQKSAPEGAGFGRQNFGGGFPGGGPR